MEDTAENKVMKPEARFWGLTLAGWQRWFGSLRTQLIIWNVIALSLLVGGLGVACHYAVQSFMMQSVDHELEKGVDMYTRPPRRPPFGPPEDRNHPPPPRPVEEHDREYDREHGGEPPLAPNPPEREARRNEPGLERDGLRVPDFHGGKHGPHGPPDRNNPYRPHHYLLNGQPETVTDLRLTWDKAGLAKALQREATANTVLFNEEPLRVYSTPAFNLEGKRGAVQIAYPLKDVQRALAEIDTVLLLLVPLGLLGAGWMGSALTNRVLRRVHWMTQAAGSIGTERGANDFSRRLPVIGTDEFAELAETFNGMLGRLDHAFQEQRQLLELQQRFTADASHELKTPLTIIKGRAGLAMGRETTDERSKRAFREISNAADSMSQLVQDLLLLARSDEGQTGQDRRELLILEILETAREQSLQEDRAPITLDVQPQTLAITGNQSELARLFRNLLDNAVRYTPANGQIHVTAHSVQGNLVVTIADTGSGIAPEHLPHLGKRFYRVDESRTRPTGGTGLGLSICRSIVDAHSGTMTLESQLGAGTTVTILLPGVSD